MKKCTALLFLCLFQNAFSSLDERSVSKIDARSLKVMIKTDSGSSALFFTDGKENRTFINALLSDDQSELAQLRLKILQDFCQGKPTGCGDVTYNSPKRIEKKSKGIVWALARYEFLLGFSSDGKNPQFYPRNKIQFKEETNWQNEHSLVKTIVLEKMSEVPDNEP